MNRFRIGGLALMLPLLAGCYQSKMSIIEDGVALPFGEIASCRINDKPLSFDLTKPDRTAAGGLTYRANNELLAFKRISDTLYLAQVLTGGVYKFGYLMKAGDGVDVLSLKPGSQSDAGHQNRAANILFKPAGDWAEMAGDRADIEAFLMGAKLGSMQSVGQCQFRKAIPRDAAITNLLKLSTTRDEALKLPGAEECDLGDICLPPSSVLASKLSAEEKAGYRYQIAFHPDRVRSITVTATAVTAASMAAILTESNVVVSSVGPYETPLSLRLNDFEVDMFRMKQLAADPKWKLELSRVVENLKDFVVMVSDSTFRNNQMLNVPAETFIKLSGVASAGAAFNLIWQRDYPYSRLVLDRSGRDKVNIRIEYVL
ncbi:hypothetical protein [Methylobacterium sp. E-045]|uniref:hypothetical protein n=1 Tax=Methylobacterium sp. E-045 TaxID=2836575 RepID=UPI001FB8FA20|nr:hypothetical protein [Methylobacterium sp. E-045]MCJ2128194.1 hypothetical protein [Methylobacterium sp. E-045]